MIASVRGIIQTIAVDHVIVEVGGIGLQVWAPRRVLGSVGQIGEVTLLHTYLHVREDALLLYGFESPAQRALFELLLGVAGIGPKVALALLSASSPEELQSAIAREDTVMLSRVPGIGKKTAARLVLELKGKFGVMNLPTAAGAAPGVLSLNNEVADILISLGYSAIEAQSAIGSLPADAPAEIEERLRLALQYFGGV